MTGGASIAMADIPEGGHLFMAPVPGALRWHQRRLQQLWRASNGAEEWRDVPNSEDGTD